jgi:hypothetical protein
MPEILHNKLNILHSRSNLVICPYLTERITTGIARVPHLHMNKKPIRIRCSGGNYGFDFFLNPIR